MWHTTQKPLQPHETSRQVPAIATALSDDGVPLSLNKLQSPHTALCVLVDIKQENAVHKDTPRSHIKERRSVVSSTAATILQLAHHVLQLLDTHYRLLKLVCDKLPVEVHCEDDEHNGDRYEDDGGS